MPALLLHRLPLGWSHYVPLLSVSDPEARRFYEIEAAENGWSVRELKRQLDSSLYQRLALSPENNQKTARRTTPKTTPKTAPKTVPKMSRSTEP